MEKDIRKGLGPASLRRRLAAIKKINKSSLFKSLSAGGIFQILNIFFQLVGVPILLKSLGVTQYGEYLALSAIPTFLFYTDLGLGVSLGNQLTIAKSASKLFLAKVLGGTFVIFTIVFNILVFILSIILCLCFNFKSELHFFTYDNDVYALSFIILILNVSGVNITVMIGTFFRALDKNALGFNLLNLQRLLLTVSFWIGCMYYKKFFPALVVSLIVEIVCIVGIIIFYQIKYNKYLPINVGLFSKKKFVGSIKPGLSYLLLTGSSALLLQGTTLLINIFSGPAALVIFSTVRTLSNFIKQTTGLVNWSLWAEYSVAIGKRNWSYIRSLFRKSIFWSVFSSICFSVLALVSGKLIFNLWLNHHIELDFRLFAMLLIANILYSAWSTASMLPSAMNNFFYIGKVAMSITIISLICMYIGGLLNLNLIIFIPIVLILGEFLMLVLTYQFSSKYLAFK